VTPLEELEHRFLPRLESTRERVAARLPDYRFSVYSSPIGSRTPLQGHDVVLECFMPDAHPDQADNVAIIVALMHLTTEPAICGASVDWGAGDNPGIHIDLVAEPIPFSSAALAEVERKYPRLDEVFEQAVSAWRKRSPAQHAFRAD